MRYTYTWSFLFGETRLFSPLKLSGMYPWMATMFSEVSAVCSLVSGVHSSTGTGRRCCFQLKFWDVVWGYQNVNPVVQPSAPLSNQQPQSVPKSSCAPGCPRCAQKCSLMVIWCVRLTSRPRQDGGNQLLSVKVWGVAVGVIRL